LRKLLIVAALTWTLAPSTARAVGTGAYGFVTDTFGFRGDVRWYYSISDPELELELLDIDLPLDIDRNFWRATGGVAFRW
jgi:hypothetical protein